MHMQMYQLWSESTSSSFPAMSPSSQVNPIASDPLVHPRMYQPRPPQMSPHTPQMSLRPSLLHSQQQPAGLFYYSIWMHFLLVRDPYVHIGVVPLQQMGFGVGSHPTVLPPAMFG